MESSNNLTAPETAPLKEKAKTERTVAFFSKVSPSFDEKFREIAFRKRIKMVELHGDMLGCYLKSNPTVGEQ